MRIAMVTDTYWPRVNGVAMSVDSFRNELTRLGHEVLVLCPRYTRSRAGAAETPEPGVVRFAAFSPPVSPEDRLVWPAQKGRVFRTLGDFRPEVIHIQTELPLGNLARKYGRKTGTPVVITAHTYFEKYVQFYVPWLPPKVTEAVTRWISSRSLGAADRVIVPSRLMEEVLVRYGVTKPIHVIPTGLDPRDFEGADKAREKGSSELYGRFPGLRGRKILLFVGRVGQEKNLDFLLDVVRNLRRAGVEGFTLLIVGDGPYRKAIDEMAAAEGLGEFIVTAGYVDRRAIAPVYAFADIFTFASVTETQGLVTIEAMLCGTPVVAVGVMGTKEVMAGDNGGYMTGDDREEFTARVRLLLEDGALLAAKSAEAREYAQNWLVGPMTGRLLEVYRQAVAGNQP